MKNRALFCTLAAGFAVIAFTAEAFAQRRIPIPCRTTDYGPSCGPILRARDTVSSQPLRHRFEQLVTGAIPSRPVVFALGLQQARIPFPGTQCFALLAPLVSLPRTADATGRARVGLDLPGKLAGTFYAQAVAWDPAQREVSSSHGLQVDCEGLLEIHSVTPLSGKAGDLITIRGAGFDPDASNQCVLVAGGAATAAVERATSTTLVARLGPIPSIATGDVCLIRGDASDLPTGTFTFNGMEGRVTGAGTIRGRVSLDAGVRFTTTETSSGTSEAIRAGNWVRLELRPGLGQIHRICIVTHILNPDLTWTDTYEWSEYRRGLVPMTDADVAAWTAAYYNAHVPGVTARSSGANVFLRSPNGTSKVHGSVAVQR